MNHQNESSSSSSRKTTYRKRKKTLKKKAEELSILCGVPVGLVCIEQDGKVETWPEGKEKVDQILKDYISKANLNSVSESQNMNRVKKKKREKYETWDSRLDYLPEESLMEILKSLESKEKILDERLRVGDVKKKRKLGVQIQDYNGDDDGLSTPRLGCQEILQIATHNDKFDAKHTLDSCIEDKSKPSSSVSDNAISESNCNLGLKLFNNGDSVIDATQFAVSLKPTKKKDSIFCGFSP